MAAAEVTGLSIALVDDQQVVWQQGFGYADKQAQIKASPDTVYFLGSIAKIFTATAAMQLAGQGQLDIDHPLQEYLPQFSIRSRFGSPEAITPRNIMTHHSGLPSNYVRGMSERHPAAFTDVVMAVKDEYMAYPPDYIFAYSNLGITLLGAAISTISGEEYSSHMQRHLLQPLGMNQSAFTHQIASKSYEYGKEIEVIPLRDLPSGGLVSTVRDISHFMQMVFADGHYRGQQIVQPERLREMFKVQNENIPLDFDFKMGLGWMLNNVEVPGGGIVARHAGTTLNSHSLVMLLPEHKLGVVVLSNSTTAKEVVNSVATETLKLALEAKRGISQPARTARKSRNVPLNAEHIRAYEGYFDTMIGLVKVSAKSGTLYAEIMGQKLELVPQEDQQFNVRFKLFGFIPIKIGALEEVSVSLHHIDGQDVLALKSNGQSMLIGKKLAPGSISRTMLDYVGDYEIINKHDGPLPDSVRMVHEDGMLIGSFTFPQTPGFVFRAALQPVNDSEMVLAGLGPGRNETLRLEKNGEEVRILFSGFELRKKPAKRNKPALLAAGHSR